MTCREFWPKLSPIDVRECVDKKPGLSYLSWASAWRFLMETYPETTYQVFPPEFLPDGSALITVTVTIDGLTREMWLPVMDNRNMAIPAPSARDISDTRMRCLVKCLAMFGLAHFLYAGEDFPGEQKPPPDKPVSAPPPVADSTAQAADWKPAAIAAIVEKVNALLDATQPTVGCKAVTDCLGEHLIMITPEEVGLRDEKVLSARLGVIENRDEAGKVYRAIEALIPKKAK